MAVAHDRSMRAELINGATDGTVRKRFSKDRGGKPESTAMFDHDQAVAMGTTPWTASPNYGEAFEREVLNGVIK